VTRAATLGSLVNVTEQISTSALFPTPEQMVEARVLAERVRRGDESDFTPWEEVAAELGL
jgi:hypothetical protein